MWHPFFEKFWFKTCVSLFIQSAQEIIKWKIFWGSAENLWAFDLFLLVPFASMSAATTTQSYISVVIGDCFNQSFRRNLTHVVTPETRTPFKLYGLRKVYCENQLRAVRQTTLWCWNNLCRGVLEQDLVATFHLDLRALKLDYKTTCDALKNWPGGPVEEQDFLEYKKQELFRALVEQSYQS